MAREVTELTASSLSFMAVRTTRFITTLGGEQVYLVGGLDLQATWGLQGSYQRQRQGHHSPSEWGSEGSCQRRSRWARTSWRRGWTCWAGWCCWGEMQLGCRAWGTWLVWLFWNWSSAAGAQLGGESGRTGVLCLWQHDQRDWERLPRLGRPIRNGTHAWHWIVGKNQEKFQDLAKMCNR